VAHGSRAKAALVAGVDPATIKRWLADPDFAAELALAQKQHADEITQTLRAAMIGSIELLVALRDDTSRADTLRRQCAYDILVLGKATLEAADVAERLARMEVAMETVRNEFHY
jgi:hypothetical protein